MAIGISLSEKLSLAGDYELNYKNKKSIEEIFNYESCYIKGKKSSAPVGDLYFGDNKDILLNFIKNKKYLFDLVYIDPPFSTGTRFESRTQNHAYSDELQGSKYIEFIRERIVLIKELMSENASIYVHLDIKMVCEIKLIMDEIFGRSNFRALITRKKSNPKNFTSKTYGNISDYLLFYSKSDQYIWNRQFVEPSENHLKEYSYIDNQGRRHMRVPLHAPGERNGETGKEWKGMMPPKGKHWQYPPSKLDDLDKSGHIHWSTNGNPRRKVYLDESKGVSVQDIWMEFKDAHNQNIKITGYPTEKNEFLLERIIKASSNKNSLILDCFAGSGTTLSVSTDLGRRWVGVDNSCESIRTIYERFSKGLKKMGIHNKSIASKNNDQPLLEGLIKNFNFFLDIKKVNLLKNYIINLSETNQDKFSNLKSFLEKI